VQTEWEPDELIGAWTLVEGDWKLIANKTGVTRLGFAVMVKFYEIEGRFPAYPEEVPRAAVGYIASLVKVDPALFAKYSWRGRTIEYHRAQIRRAYGTRPATEADEDRWARSCVTCWPMAPTAPQLAPICFGREHILVTHRNCARHSGPPFPIATTPP